MYVSFFFFNKRKKTARSAISNFSKNYVVREHSRPGILIIAFVVGLNSVTKF